MSSKILASSAIALFSWGKPGAFTSRMTPEGRRSATGKAAGITRMQANRMEGGEERQSTKGQERSVGLT
jgi:hypothetical protein